MRSTTASTQRRCSNGRRHADPHGRAHATGAGADRRDLRRASGYPRGRRARPAQRPGRAVRVEARARGLPEPRRRHRVPHGAAGVEPARPDPLHRQPRQSVGGALRQAADHDGDGPRAAPGPGHPRRRPAAGAGRGVRRHLRRPRRQPLSSQGDGQARLDPGAARLGRSRRGSRRRPDRAGRRAGKSPWPRCTARTTSAASTPRPTTMRSGPGAGR